MSIVAQYLKDAASIQPPPTGFNSPYTLLRTFGKSFCPSPLPEGIERGVVRECFANATKLVLADLSLVYVEGYAVVQGLSLPIHHGWVVDVEGNVIDNTWSSPGVEYFGIPFDSDYVLRAAITSETYGILFNHCWRNILTDPAELFVSKEFA